MGNLCTSSKSADDERRKPQSHRKGSGSTTGFSPTEDPEYDGTNAGAINGESRGGAAGSTAGPGGGRGPGAGVGMDRISTSEVDVLVPPGAALDRSRRSDRSPHRRDDHRNPATASRPGTGGVSPGSALVGTASAVAGAGAAAGGGGGSSRDGESGGERSERSERTDRRHREARGRDGDRRSSRREHHGKSSRTRDRDASGGGGGTSSRTREGKGGSSSRRRDSERGSQGDQSGRRPRSERSEKEIAERKERRERERAARANGDPETEEARKERRDKKERRERRKRREQEATAAAAGAAAAGGGGGPGDAGEKSGDGVSASASGSAGFHGSTDSKRERKSSRRKHKDAEARGNFAGDAGSSRERGSGGAVGVMAGSGGSVADGAAGSVVMAEPLASDRKGKRGSSLRKMYDSLTGGFSGSAAQHSASGAAGGGSGGGVGGGGGGPAGGGGGGGGGTSSGKGASSRQSRTSARNQLVTSVTSRDVREKYEIERSQLGHGHYGVVRRCWDKETREGYAIKTIKKSKVSRIESLRREIEILRCVDHPCIIKLYDVYEDDRFIHLVTELCTGGELFDRIIQKTESEEGHYSEKDAKVVVASILSGIEYCHNEHNICHRDLKPENFLFKKPDSDTEIKIIDFGLSRFEDMQTAMTTRVGTPYYIAPEVLSRKYDKACDLWSIGVITYILLAGYPPFYGESDQEIFASVRHGYFDFPSPEWDNISTEAKDFITQLLQKDPAARMSATESINHRWFDTPPGGPLAAAAAASGDGDDDKRDKVNMQVSMQRINHRLRRFVGMSKLKKVALNVIAQKLTEAEIGHLRGVFERLDSEGNAVISVNELQQVVQQEGLGNLQEDVVRLLQGIDIDGSNSVNYREFLAATMERNIFIREENIRCAFDYFDLDGNAEITLSNLVKIFGAEEHAREIMGDLNLPGEGVISYAEFKSMMTEMPLDGREQMTPRTPRSTAFVIRP